MSVSISEIFTVLKMLSLHRKNIRALSLIVCTLTYLMIGAAVFDALESGKDTKNRELVSMIKQKMNAKYNFTERDFRVLETIVVKSVPHKAGPQWQFAGAFYFATVVVTVVGYGHSTPATRWGKIFCMLYALVGIPLNLVMFQSIGERLNTFIAYALLKVKRCLRLKRQDVSQSQMLMVSGTLGTMVMIFGAYIFHLCEPWTLFESFYYCFITLTTIGFGDYVAIQRDGALRQRIEYFIFSLLFILFGLAMFSAAVNLFVLRFMATNADSDASETAPHASVLLRGVSEEDLADTPASSIRRHNERDINGESSMERNHTRDVWSESSGKRPIEQETSCCPSCCPMYGNRGRSILKRRNEVDPFNRPSKPRYTVRRSPVAIDHLVSIHQFAQAALEASANGPVAGMNVTAV